MGKVHRIKKQFWKLVAQETLPVGTHHFAGTAACVYVGKAARSGETFLLSFSSDHGYKPLMKKLLKEYEGRGSS